MSKKVIIENKQNLLIINKEWIKKINKISTTLFDECKKRSKNKKLFYEGKLPYLSSTYFFGKEDVLVDDIPSVFVSKSTLMNSIPKKESEKIAKRITVKNVDRIAKK